MSTISLRREKIMEKYIRWWTSEHWNNQIDILELSRWMSSSEYRIFDLQDKSKQNRETEW